VVIDTGGLLDGPLILGAATCRDIDHRQEH
jgi:hypothetical protein